MITKAKGDDSWRRPSQNRSKTGAGQRGAKAGSTHSGGFKSIQLLLRHAVLLFPHHSYALFPVGLGAFFHVFVQQLHISACNFRLDTEALVDQALPLLICGKIGLAWVIAVGSIVSVHGDDRNAACK